MTSIEWIIIGVLYLFPMIFSIVSLYLLWRFEDEGNTIESLINYEDGLIIGSFIPVINLCTFAFCISTIICKCYEKMMEWDWLYNFVDRIKNIKIK